MKVRRHPLNSLRELIRQDTKKKIHTPISKNRYRKNVRLLYEEMVRVDEVCFSAISGIFPLGAMFNTLYPIGSRERTVLTSYLMTSP